MAYTKDQILGFTGGSVKGEDVYRASQQHGFTAADYDQAFGAAPGTAQAWIDKNITPTKTATPTATLDTPPATTPAATTVPAATTAPAATTVAAAPSLNTPPATPPAAGTVGGPVHGTPNNSNPGNDPMIAMKQLVDRPNFWKDGGKVDLNDAMALYGFATGGKMDAKQVSMATGIPEANINKWLQDHNLSLGGQVNNPTTNTSPRQTYVPSLNNPPVVTPVTQQTQPNETAAYQLVELLKSNSPYIQQLRKDAMRDAAGRNLINSDWAIEHATAAGIRGAAPIAINDANTYSRQAINNQDSRNDANRTQAQLQTSLEQTNAQLAQSDRESIRSTDQSERESLRSNETSRLNQLAQNETSLNLENLSNASQLAVEQLRIRADINLGDRNSRTNAFANMITSIGNIEANTEMNATQKTEAINRTVGYYEQFLSYQDALLGKAA